MLPGAAQHSPMVVGKNQNATDRIDTAEFDASNWMYHTQILLLYRRAVKNSATLLEDRSRKCCYELNYLRTYSMEQSFSEKRTGIQLVQKFPAFYGNRNFISTFTSAHNLFLS
jgi:hypothetical protein